MTKKYDDSEGVWRTIGGRRVFIRTGQSLSDAMKESGKFNTNKNKETQGQQYEDYKRAKLGLQTKESQDDFEKREARMMELAKKMDDMTDKGQQDDPQFKKMADEYDKLLEQDKKGYSGLLDNEDQSTKLNEEEMAFQEKVAKVGGNPHNDKYIKEKYEEMQETGETHIDGYTYKKDDFTKKESNSNKYEELAVKDVTDSDGFTTEYTMYKTPDGKYKMVFGDREVYGPDADSDMEFDTIEEATEWFDDYKGFEENEYAEDIMYQKDDGSFENVYTAMNDMNQKQAKKFVEELHENGSIKNEDYNKLKKYVGYDDNKQGLINSKDFNEAREYMEHLDKEDIKNYLDAKRKTVSNGWYDDNIKEKEKAQQIYDEGKKYYNDRFGEEDTPNEFTPDEQKRYDAIVKKAKNAGISDDNIYDADAYRSYHGELLSPKEELNRFEKYIDGEIKNQAISSIEHDFGKSYVDANKNSLNDNKYSNWDDERYINAYNNMNEKDKARINKIDEELQKDPSSRNANKLQKEAQEIYERNDDIGNQIRKSVQNANLGEVTKKLKDRKITTSQLEDYKKEYDEVQKQIDKNWDIIRTESSRKATGTAYNAEKLEKARKEFEDLGARKNELGSIINLHTIDDSKSTNEIMNDKIREKGTKKLSKAEQRMKDEWKQMYGNNAAQLEADLKISERFLDENSRGYKSALKDLEMGRQYLEELKQGENKTSNISDNIRNESSKESTKKIILSSSKEDNEIMQQAKKLQTKILNNENATEKDFVKYQELAKKYDIPNMQRNWDDGAVKSLERMNIEDFKEFKNSDYMKNEYMNDKIRKGSKKK